MSAAAALDGSTGGVLSAGFFALVMLLVAALFLSELAP